MWGEGLALRRRPRVVSLGACLFTYVKALAAPAPGVSRRSWPKVCAATSASRARPSSSCAACASSRKPFCGP
jgi:hypothetical protein